AAALRNLPSLPYHDSGEYRTRLGRSSGEIPPRGVVGEAGVGCELERGSCDSFGKLEDHAAGTGRTGSDGHAATEGGAATAVTEGLGVLGGVGAYERCAVSGRVRVGGVTSVRNLDDHSHMAVAGRRTAELTGRRRVGDTGDRDLE